MQSAVEEVKYRSQAAEACFVETAEFNASLIPAGTRGRLLDIGAYKGYLRGHLPAGLEYQGLDLQTWGLACITVADLNSGKLPFDDASFDCIIACNVVEHLLVHPAKTIAEIARVAKPGAFVLISLPNDRGLASLLFGNAGISRLFFGVTDLGHQEFGHHWSFDVKLARTLLETRLRVDRVVSHPGHYLRKIPILNRIDALTSDLYFLCSA